VDRFGRYEHFAFEIDVRRDSIRQVLLVATLTKYLMASVLPQTFVGSTSKVFLFSSTSFRE